MYEEEQLSCLGESIEGVIREVAHDAQTGDVFVFGGLVLNEDTYPEARYDGENWDYISIPKTS